MSLSLSTLRYPHDWLLSVTSREAHTDPHRHHRGKVPPWVLPLDHLQSPFHAFPPDRHYLPYFPFPFDGDDDVCGLGKR